MAAPHAAGLLAYLLSLYPSKDFDPFLDDGLIPSSLQNQHPFSAMSFTSIYSIAHASLPGFITEYLPSPKLLEAITSESQGPPTLTPLQLKRALLGLASKGILGDLPPKTPNLLIFNNATS
jgi:cerevisin